MPAKRVSAPLSYLVFAWAYGLICGLGIAASIVGMTRGEGVVGVLWPGLVPLLLAPVLILLLGRKTTIEQRSEKDA